MGKFVSIILVLAVAVSFSVTGVFAISGDFDEFILIRGNGTWSPELEIRDNPTKSYSLIIPDGSKRLDFHDNTADLTRMSITNAGNVGINTKIPLEKLHIIGNMRITGDIIAIGDMKIDPTGDLCLGSGCP